MGECICRNGFSGPKCEEGAAPECPKKDYASLSRCLDYTLTYGSSRVVDPKLWSAFQKWELDNWTQNKASPDLGDRVAQHMKWYQNYSALKELVQQGKHRWGRVLEMGSGPHTQTLFMLARTNVSESVESLTLVDPLIDQYLVSVSGVPYREKRTFGPYNRPIHLVKSGAEESQFILRDKGFDTVVMINVIEHCLNGWEALQVLYNKLRPGGILVLHEYYYDFKGFHVDHGHPVTFRKAAYDKFLKHFEVVYRKDFYRVEDYRHTAGLYYIGRKPLDAAA